MLDAAHHIVGITRNRFTNIGTVDARGELSNYSPQLSRLADEVNPLRC